MRAICVPRDNPRHVCKAFSVRVHRRPELFKGRVKQETGRKGIRRHCLLSFVRLRALNCFAHEVSRSYTKNLLPLRVKQFQRFRVSAVKRSKGHRKDAKHRQDARTCIWRGRRLATDEHRFTPTITKQFFALLRSFA